MQSIPENVAIAFEKRLEADRLNPPWQAEYRKWLRYYLDFCAKYRHPPGERDSLPEFLRKLSAKGQGVDQQQTAAASVQTYFAILKGGLAQPGGSESGWEDCLTRLKEEVRLRQYSPKTLQTYRVWVIAFREFLQGKGPEAVDRKGKHAAKELIWQWFFPARNLTFVPEEGGHRRYHMHETSLATALRVAVRKSGVTKRVTCHTFRHSFASHLLRANYDIRTIQEMLGHSNVTTTMIYTHTVKSRTLKERRSPLDLSAATVDELAPDEG